MMISTVLILPASLQQAGNNLAIAMGHDDPPGHTYCVPLSGDGQEPATHYGCHAWATEAFVSTIAGAAQGQMPQGLDAELVATVLGGLISSIGSELTPREHFDATLAANGLQQIVPTTV